jgi:hypothetical protein
MRKLSGTIKQQIADVFTKKSVKTDAILRVITEGNLMMY